jgi:ubiquitin carboxyl-terminal hydrolase 34
VSTIENWAEQFLMAHPTQKVRSSAACLIVSLVPNIPFRQAFRAARTLPNPLRETLLAREETETFHQILEFLFSLLPNARQYTDLQQHGSAKLVSYFQTMSHFLLTKTEKRMFEPHFMNLWQLFHPKLSEPAIPVHHNKQALLNFWQTLCVDCPENVRLVLRNPHVTKNIAYNYILADHEDADVVNFNRVMLPTYYGLLRMCCQQSRAFTRQLAQHQNLQWAFKNITPYTTQYTLACEELFKLMALFVQKVPAQQETSHADDGDKSEACNLAERDSEVITFRHQTLQLYLSILDGRTSWNTLIQVFFSPIICTPI